MKKRIDKRSQIGRVIVRRDRAGINGLKELEFHGLLGWAFAALF